MLRWAKSSYVDDLKSKSFWEWRFENQNQNHIENQMILKSF